MSKKKIGDADKLITRYTGSNDPAHRLKLARTIFTKGALLIQVRHFEPALAAFNLLLQSFHDCPDEAIQIQIAKSLLDRAAVLDILGRREEALAGYDELINRFGNAPGDLMRGHVASGMFNKASVLTRLERKQEALAALEDCLKDSVKLPDRLLAKALWMKVECLENAGRYNDSLAACERLIKTFADKRDIVDLNWLCEIMLDRVNILIALERPMDVISAYQAAEERFGPVAEEVMGARTAQCLVDNLHDHLKLNRMTEALALAEHAISAFGAFVDPPWFDVAQTSAKARVVALCRLGRVAPCLAAYDVVVEKYGDMLDSALRREVASLLLNDSAVLATRRDYAAADTRCDQLIQRFKPSDDLEIATLAARAMFNKITLKTYMADTSAVMPTCDAFLDRFRYSTHPVICEMLFYAWNRKAAMLDSQHSDSEAVAAYDAAVKAGKALCLPPLPLATVMANKAVCLGRLSKPEQQLEAYDELIAAFADSTAPGVRAVVAPAMLARAFMLRESGQLESALRSCRQFIELIERATPAAMLVPLARAMFLRGELLEKLGRDDEAASAYGTVAERFDFNGETESRKCLPVALFNQAALLEKMGRHEAAIQALDVFMDRARGEPDLIPHGLRAQAMRNRAAILAKLHQTDAAMAAYQEVVETFDGADPALSLLVREAMVKRAELLPQAPQLQESLPVVQASDQPTPQASQEQETPAEYLVAAGVVKSELTEERAAEQMGMKSEVPLIAESKDSAPDTDMESPAGQLVYLRTIKWSGRGAELIAASDEFIKRYGQSESSAIRRDVAEAFRMKIEMVAEVGSLEDQLRACNAFMLKFGREMDVSFAPMICQTMLDMGRIFSQMDRPEHERSNYDAMILRFGNATDVALRGHLLEVLMRQAAMAGQQGRLGDEVRCYQKIVSKFGAIADTDVQRQVATAMLDTGLAFRKLERKLDELAVYDAIIKRFGKAEDTGTSFIVARAMMRKALTQAELGKRLEQIAICDAIIARFSSADSLFLRQLAARSQCNRALALAELGKIEDAMVAFDEVIKTFDHAGDPPLRVCAGVALFQKAQLLRQQRHRTEAIACFGYFIQNYQMNDEEISGLVSQAQALLRIL